MSSGGRCRGEKPSNVRRKGKELGRGAVINVVREGLAGRGP